MASEAFDMELDLRAYPRPLPMVRIGQNIRSIPVGHVLKAVATKDPAIQEDIHAWSRLTGHEIFGVVTEGEETTLFVRRTG